MTRYEMFQLPYFVWHTPENQPTIRIMKVPNGYLLDLNDGTPACFYKQPENWTYEEERPVGTGNPMPHFPNQDYDFQVRNMPNEPMPTQTTGGEFI